MKRFALLLLFLTMSVSFAQAQTIRYVKQGGTGNGSSWANASGDLQAMINASAAGDEVWVAAGTYKPNAYPRGCTGCSTPRDYTFHLKNGVKLYGGFASTGNLGFADRDWMVNETILSGDIGTVGNVSDNVYHVVLSVSDIVTTILDGFTVSGGNANVSGSITVEGRGIFRGSGGDSSIKCVWG